MVFNGFSVIKAFLNNILTAVLALLTILSCVLIYSMMLSNVNEKTYEFGMLRSLGLPQTKLINILILNAMFFSVPGLALGLIICYVINSLISWFIFSFTGLYDSYELNYHVITIGLLVGIVVPLISNILPI